MSSSDLPTCSSLTSSSNVSDKVVAYYLKYAKHRDIEKFMRISICEPSTSTSSADSEVLIAVQRLDEVSAADPLDLKKNEEPVEQAPPTKVDEATQTPEKNCCDTLPAQDSVTKTGKRLEWDSLGDVGYKKASSTGNLSSLERSVLKELFAESPSEPNISRQVSNEEKTSSRTSINPQQRRERWRQTLEHLGRKYSSVDSQLFLPQPQNTPEVLSNGEKPSQTEPLPTDSREKSDKFKAPSSLSIDSSRVWQHPWEELGDKYSVSRSIDSQLFVIQPQSTPKLQANTEKSCQTSFDKKKPQRTSISRLTDHSCQTSFDQRPPKLPDISEKFCQTSIAKLRSQEVQANLSSRTESFATQSSFEYHAGDDDSTKSSARRSILSERNSNTIQSRASSDSDKENRLTKKASGPKTEVDLGIKLLCSLIDAKNLTSKQKKNLAKKIFEKIVQQQSSASTSTSVTSRSSALSGLSLINSSPPHEVEENRSESISIPIAESRSVQQMSEETQTEEQNLYERPPTSSSSLDDPVTMREWLNPLTRSEKDYEKKHKKEAVKEVSPPRSERSKQLSWIELEINRLEGLKNLLIQERSPKSRSKSRSVSSKSSIQSDNRAGIIYEETTENVVKEVDKYKRTTRTTQNVVIYDEPTPDNGKQPDKVKYKTTRVVIDEEHLPSTSASVKNHRRKLETPSSSSTPSPECQSVSAFADQLQKQFMENYAKKERCVSEHYSEPRICGKPIFTRNPSYTSVASSAFCMSSEMSIPIVESSSTSTTTHQYDSHGGESIEGVAVQTTYSIIKTEPIFGPRCKCICTCGKACKCSCPKPTVRVSGKAYHQTVQVKPKALAYVIRFTGTSDNEGKKVTEDYLTLRQRLERQNPDFCSKANERREILKKLHKLRQEREQRIREIAETSNMSSISRKLEQLPPPPIKHVRICPTKEMKGMTRKRYFKLPEVVAKQEREKLERRKKTTRMITNIFNKKLQRMVHNGKLSLDFSRTVI